MAGMNGLPPRFPCWCKATYSWGGETKKDLGFIEGDLIEALNAGDGQWWTGRLRRDPRAIGLFPSNFVQVLDEAFQPAPNSRNASPLPIQTAAQAKKPARKPFQAYGGSGLKVGEKEATPESDKERAPEKKKFRPYSSMKTMQAPSGSLRKSVVSGAIKQELGPVIPSTPPRRGLGQGSRSHASLNGGSVSSPRPVSMYETARTSRYTTTPSQRDYQTPSPTGYHHTPSPQYDYRRSSPQPQYRAPSPQPDYRAPSPAPPRSQAPSPAPPRPHSPLPASYHDGSAFPQLLPASRQPSPNPYQQADYYSAPPSPSQIGHNDYVDSSPPPPPPPAHRVAYQQSRAPSPQPPHYAHHQHESAQTPVHRSPSVGSHVTPSPLRDAINDVMMSLQDMTASSQSPPPAPRAGPVDVWSPEAFELVRTQSRDERRNQSAMGFSNHRQQFSHGNVDEQPSLPSSRDGLPQLGDYVQRMEHQLQNDGYHADQAPQPPLKGTQFSSPRPVTAGEQAGLPFSSQPHHFESPTRPLKHRKSAYELGRTYTTKTNVTNSTESSSATQSSTSTQLTSRSIMSGASASGLSATSAGSLTRHKFSLGSQRRRKGLSIMETKSTNDLFSSARSMAASESSGSGPSYHESHASYAQPDQVPEWTNDGMGSNGIFGGLGAPKARKSGFFRKMIDSAKTTARTGAATARSTIASTSRPGSRAGSPTKSQLGNSMPTGFGGGIASRPVSSAGPAARDMGLGNDWMQVRRDINRSNSLSRRELEERAERCELHGITALRPIEQLHEFVEGDEGVDGTPIYEPSDFNTPNLALVDKNTRFIQSIPPMVTAPTLAQNYVCRPYKSDVQRLRAIFTWVAERIAWEEDFEGHVDTRRVVQTKRGCSQEIAMLVVDMCSSVGLHCEVVRGYLKRPGEIVDLDTLAQPNHWWNAVIVDNEWRIMDCSLANPTHPRRGLYSTASSQAAESWYFLARPLEICYTHIPLLPEQQHIVPAVEHEVLAALPCATPAYFRQGVELSDFDTSMLYLENLEMAHVHVAVPEDVECIAEAEARAFAQDSDGDFFESGDTVKKQVLAQVNWIGGRKHYTIKAVLPNDDGHGTLKIYAGKRGLMHSIRDNPHSMALALPLSHTGQNPPYDFVTRHPTPHAQRHDLYVAQPQCSRLTMNNTFVFCVRQHPSSLSRFSPDNYGSAGGSGRPGSPNPMARPSSAMSMVSASVSGSQFSDLSSNASSSQGQPLSAAQQKPAKLAIQSPSQKIIRLTRKMEYGARSGDAADLGLTTSWETVIKIGEKGTWRGLVLADRSARWCVFAEWECV